MEILSPASNIDHINVAIDNKANAVYGGLKNWNARNKAINFTTDEYNQVIKLLHEKNMKFYLTLNILMLDEEINEVIEFLKNNSLPDSFIVSDIGLIQKLKSEFPDIPLHFSTQFGAHCIDDVNYIKDIGGKRAILARELTKKEITNIKNHSSIELETFIWGSQCLSFSGLCFFGTLINGGGGNRGKCIITCRDVYSTSTDKGHFLYVPDMNCLNSIDDLKSIDCLKIEGRRRNPKEIEQVLNKINNIVKTEKNVGYYYGKNIKENNLYEKINSRIKPLYEIDELDEISNNDIFVKFDENGIPLCFSNDYADLNVKYVYSEIKKNYDLKLKNITLDFTIQNGIINKVLYVNYKGEGKTFESNDNNYIEFNFIDFRDLLESNNKKINLYKMNYKRTIDYRYQISKNLVDEVIKYIIADCCEKNMDLASNEKFKIKKLYIETSETDIIDKIICDDSSEIIYNISTIEKLKNISMVINKYGNKIIYKLPMFNWSSEDLSKYYNLLSNKKVMFTRLSQIYVTRNIEFEQKLVDYTVYIWNKLSKDYLRKYNIDLFTASPELSYEKNNEIYENDNFQVIVAGKLPLVYTRGCFGHILGCNSCFKDTKKVIKNEDKSLLFNIKCESDYRMLYYQYPILNNYSKVKYNDKVSYRYVITDETEDEFKETINIFKNSNSYYSDLNNMNYWKNSYECNLLDSRD